MSTRGLSSRNATARRLQDKADTDVQARQHVDKAIRAEEVDASAQQVADTGLGNLRELAARITYLLARRATRKVHSDS
jgi:hypothetical protein